MKTIIFDKKYKYDLISYKEILGRNLLLIFKKVDIDDFLEYWIQNYNSNNFIEHSFSIEDEYCLTKYKVPAIIKHFEALENKIAITINYKIKN